MKPRLSVPRRGHDAIEGVSALIHHPTPSVASCEVCGLTLMHAYFYIPGALYPFARQCHACSTFTFHTLPGGGLATFRFPGQHPVQAAPTRHPAHH